MITIYGNQNCGLILVCYRMPISIKQLETLAQHFRFDMDEARAVIGLPIKSSSTIKQSSTVKGSVSGKGSKKVEKPEKEKPKARGPTGYNLYVRESGISFKNAGASWRALSDSEKAEWNARARG